jgi:large subunit ribosomal protein L6e
MSTPSTQPTKTASSAGGKTTTTTTVVKKTTTTTTSAAAKQLQQKTVGAGSKTKTAKTASGKKVINAHHNAPLASEGLMRFSRGRMFHRRALYRLSKWKGEHAKLKETETATGKTKKTAGSIQKKKQRPQALKKKPIGGERNGKERLVRTKRYPRYYPTEERPKKFSVKRKTFSSHPRRFRSSLTPGTVVILVAGKHAGKRAVVVKHLSSGLLLITGPHKLNGVPLRRMNQIYVIATSTKIDLSSAQVADLDDKFFKRVRKTKKNAETDIFDSKKEKTPLNEERRQAQLNVDTAVLNAIKAQADSRLLRRYLKSRFQLWNGVLPHKLNF